MESDAPPNKGKIFLGGLSWETNEEKLKEHFGKYGPIVEVIVMRDRVTGKPRGFGFITFETEEAAQKACEDTHTLDGRTIDAKPSVPQESGQRPRSKKIFVGGLAPETTPEEFKLYFERFGKVVEAQIMVDHTSHRSRGFGFITFEEESSVFKVFSAGAMHELSGKRVEVKNATPKGSGPQGRGGGLVLGPPGAPGVAVVAAPAGGMGMMGMAGAAGMRPEFPVPSAAAGFPGMPGFMAPGYVMPGYGGYMPYPGAFPGMMMGGFGYPAGFTAPHAYPAAVYGQAGAFAQQQMQQQQQAPQQAPQQQAQQQVGASRQPRQQPPTQNRGTPGATSSNTGGGSSRGGNGGGNGGHGGGNSKGGDPGSSTAAAAASAASAPVQQQQQQQPVQQAPAGATQPLSDGSDQHR